MGQKVNPIGLRLGIVEPWRSRWYASGKEYGSLVVEDQKIRRLVKGNYRFGAIARIEIERTLEEVRIILHSARPGLIIGRRGAEVDKLRAKLGELTGRDVQVDIREILVPELEAQLVAEEVADQLSRRGSFRRTLKRAAETVMQAGGLGVRIAVAGRLGGSEMSRREDIRVGAVPLQTLRAWVDYGFSEAKTPYGHIGVKVWIHKKKEEKVDNAPHA
jgi:small subunit ribosomal protein S3